MPHTTKYPVNEKNVRVVTQDIPEGSIQTSIIEDVLVPMTLEERYEFLRDVAQQDIEPEECCTTYLVQRHLANYRGEEKERIAKNNLPKESSIVRRFNAMEAIHGLTTCFIPLESHVNNAPSTNPQENLNLLLSQDQTSGIIAQFKEKLIERIQAFSPCSWSEDSQAQAEIKALWKATEEKITARIEHFKLQITHLREKMPPPTSEEVLELFETKNISIEWKLAPEDYTLDTLMAACMGDVLNAGISTVHAIKEESLWARFKSHWWESASGKALSRAKTDLRENFSTLGLIRRGFHKTPQDQLDCLTGEDPPTANNPKQQLQSLTPYKKGGWNYLGIDAVLCRTTGVPLKNRKNPSLAYDAVKWAAAVPELGYSSLRLIGEGLSLLAYGAGYTLETTVALLIYPSRLIYVPDPETSFGKFYKECASHEGLTSIFNACHRGLSTVHRYISNKAGAFRAQHLWDKQYQSVNGGGEHAELQNLLDHVNQPKNWLHHSLDRADPVAAVQYIAHSLWAVGKTGLDAVMEVVYYNPPQLPQFMRRPSEESPKKSKKQQKLEETAQRLALMEWFLDRLSSVKDTSTPTSSEKAIDSVSLKEDEADEASEELEQIYPSPAPSHKTNIDNPYAVVNDIFVILRKIIEEGFQEDAGPTTLFCTAALAALATGVGVVPITGKVMAAMANGVQTPAKWLAHHAMGQSFNDSLTAKLFSTFLEYKLAYLGTKTAKAAVEGDTEFFQRVFHDPGKFILGAMVCVALGTSVAYWPSIPDINLVLNLPYGVTDPGLSAYKELFNGMLHENKEALHHGTPGLNGMEVGFVGFKSLLFLHSLITGYRFENDKQKVAVFQLVTEVHKLRVRQQPVHLNTILSQDKYACFSDTEKESINNIFNTLTSDSLPSIDLTEKSDPHEELQEARSLLKKEMARIKKNPAIYTACGTLAKESNFNYVHYIVDRYNRAQCALGHDHKQIKSEKFMPEFGNQYYEGSPSIIRLFYASLPIYGITILHRLYKSPFEWYSRWREQERSPYKDWRSNKSFHKDASNVEETLSAVGGSFIDASFKATKYVARGLVGTLTYGVFVLPTALVTTLINNTWHRNSPEEDKIKWANNVARTIDNIIRPVKLPTTDNFAEWSGFKKLARWSAKKASTSHNVQEAADTVLKQIEENEEAAPRVVSISPILSEKKLALSDKSPLDNESMKDDLSLTDSSIRTWDGNISSSSTSTNNNSASFFCQPKTREIKTLKELADEPKNSTQRDVLEVFARAKDEETVLEKEHVDKLLNQLPKNWHSVVRENYLPPKQLTCEV